LPSTVAEPPPATTGPAQDDVAFAGPAALAALVRDREVRPRELVELFLARIERIDPRLNAFRTVLADEALAAADALERELGGGARDAVQWPLAGVPIAIKDDMALAGQALTFGSRSPAEPQAHDAEAIRRLRAAGAIPIGITNVPELMLFPWTASDANGITRNPWDPTRTPGGSSGGSAAAVAAGLVPAATASDGAGSIRIPAGCCGLVGMKPSRGRVSTQPAAEGWLGMTTFGALARTTLDSALLLDVMQGAVEGDADRAPSPAITFRQAAATPPGRLRIAVSRKLPAGVIARLSADQRLAFDRTTRLLVELGHDVVERDPAYGLAALEVTQTYLRAIADEVERLADSTATERSTRQLAAAGRVLVSRNRRDTLRAKRAATAARILALWDQHDVLLTPGLACTALPAEGGYRRPGALAFQVAVGFTPWTPVFNLTGQPAVTLPAGFGGDGLPLSVQLVGRIGDELSLYSLAAQIEAARPWAAHRPPVSTDRPAV
jgi:amidase